MFLAPRYLTITVALEPQVHRLDGDQRYRPGTYTLQDH